MSDPRQPVLMRWDGKAMRPVNPRAAFGKYRQGETYRMAAWDERSRASHNHQFAEITQIWRNLPEDIADKWPTDEHLRKWLLIKCGYRDEARIVCASRMDAYTAAAAFAKRDEFAVIDIDVSIVTVLSAQSQSIRAMGKAIFEQSKADILAEGAKLIGVTPQDLAKNAQEAA